MIAVSITLAELDRHHACTESGGRELLSVISTLQWGQDTGEVVVPKWAPLHTVWLAWAYPDHAAWLRDEGIVPDANLRDADLGNADLGNADLGNADLRGADLRYADLRGADLRGADLRGANLGGANLVYADLRGANLRSANLRGANFGGAYLEGAYRSVGDAPIPGWKIVDGRLRRGL